jgi:DNA gyrase/topoisomerase IV subunit A
VGRGNLMNRLLTKKDLAERWQVDEKTIDVYRDRGIITAVKGLPSVRFNPQHIEDIEGTKLEKFSPLERKKLERELEEMKKENDTLRSILRNFVSEGIKAAQFVK